MATSSAVILLESRAYLTSLTTVEGALYGLAFALYAFCAQSLYFQLKDRDRRRKHLFTLLYMSLIMVLALFGVAVDAQDIQTSYVDHASYPDGGSFGYSVNVLNNSPVTTTNYITILLYNVMVLGIQIWRLWVIWSASRYSVFIVILPGLTLLMYIGIQIMGIVFIQRQLFGIHLKDLVLYGSTAIQLYISVTVTTLIIGKILMVQRKNMKLTGQTNVAGPYTSVISMLIESFALESVWLVAQLTLTLFSNPIAVALDTLFFNTLPFIQILAYLLVVHRVATGHEWEGDTEEKLTMSLQWNRDGMQTTQISTRASVLITEEEV